MEFLANFDSIIASFIALSAGWVGVMLMGWLNMNKVKWEVVELKQRVDEVETELDSKITHDDLDRLRSDMRAICDRTDKIYELLVRSQVGS